MVRLKKYRKLTGVEKMRQDQKDAHQILNLSYIDSIISYACSLNEDQIKYMYQKLDDDYIKYKNKLKEIRFYNNYIKNHSEDFSDVTLEEINNLGRSISMINYLLSDLKYLKKELKSELDLRNSEFYTSFKNESPHIIKAKEQLKEIFNNRLIDPIEFYETLGGHITTMYHINKDKKRFKLLQRVKNM